MLFTPLKAPPLLWPALGWLLGVALARLDGVPVLWCVLLLLLVFFAYTQWRNSWLLACALGLAYGLLSFVWDVQQVRIDDSWLHNKLEVTAVIDDVRQTKGYTRLTLSDVAQAEQGRLPGMIQAYVYHSAQPFQAGMQVSLLLKLHLPHNKQNPSYFDYEQYCFERHITAVASVSGKVKVLAHDELWVESLRNRVRSALSKLDGESQGVLLALLLGDRSMIPLHIDDAFAASGATHLLAISGLHVGLVAGWGFILAWWLLTRREAWIVAYPVRAVALSAGMLLACFYAILAGWPIPAQRASLMLLAGVVAWWFRGNQVPLNTMLAALICIVLIDPASILSISLWLSFTATSALLIWTVSQSKVESIGSRVWMWSKGMLWVSVVASLATLPLIGLFFERMPVWSLLANVLLVPLYSLWVLPLALLGEFSSLLGLEAVADAVFQCAAVGLGWGNSILLSIQQFPAGDLWLRGDLPWVCCLLLLCFLVSGCLWREQRKVMAICLLLSSLLIYAGIMTTSVEVQRPRLDVWDVGQGASALLQSGDFNLLVDVPGREGSKFNGGTIAAENARELGVLHLDALAVTHAQMDHAGGVARLLASLHSVGELWLADVPENHKDPMIRHVLERVSVRWLKQGDTITFADGTNVKVLWPPLAYQPRNSNNASLVLQIRLPTGQTLLLPGDMEKHVEQSMLSDWTAVDVLLMPHHGSKTSSSIGFVERVKPRLVISQVGYHNHYGFPQEHIVQRYRLLGSRMLNTAEGAVTLVFFPDSIDVRQFSFQGSSKRAMMMHLLQ